MPVSYLSTLRKSNPYVAPVDIGLMTKVLTLKDQQFKQNASKVQSEIDAIGTIDLIKGEDKEYLNGKLNSLVNGINELGGVDLGDFSVANQLHGMTQSVYGDNDLLTAISSSQSVRKLQSQYDKMMTDPKLQKSFAPQNYAHDMKFVSDYINNGKRTTFGEGYNGPTNPTPFFNLDAYAVDVAKRVKANYTKSTTKDGIYLVNGTNKEVTADQIRQEILSSINENPQAMRQAQINAAYLKPNISGQELYNNDISELTKATNAYKTIYDKYEENYKTLSAEEQIKRVDERNQIKGNYESYQNALKQVTLSGPKAYNDNLDAYRTKNYIDNMTNHLSNAFSFIEQSQEIKPDLAAIGLLKVQADLAQHGLQAVPSVTNPSGYDIVSKPGATQTKSSNGSNNIDVTSGALIPNVNKDDKNKLIQTDETVSQNIVKLNTDKQVLAQSIIGDAIQLVPELAGQLGSKQAQELLISGVKNNNDPNTFEIEDIKNLASNPYLNQQQKKYIDDLWISYTNIQKGQAPLRSLSIGQVEKLNQINALDKQKKLLEQLRAKSMGIDYESLNAAEQGAISDATSSPENLKKYKPKLLASRFPDERMEGDDPLFSVGAADALFPGITTNLKMLNTIRRGTKSGLYGIEKLTSYGRNPNNSLVVYEKDGKYFPIDGKTHTYSTSYTSVGDNKANNKQLTITNKGISKDELINYVQPYDRSVTTIKNDLTEVLLADTPEKENFYKAINKKSEKKMIVKDPTAYDALNNLSSYNNYAYTPDMDVQKSDNFQKEKALIAETAKTGQTPLQVLDAEGKLINNEVKFLTPDQISKSYISRIGTSSTNPLNMQIDMVVPMDVEVGKKTIKSSITIRRDVTRNELFQTVGIALPTEEQMYDKVSLDINGRTLEKVYTPVASPNPNLLISMEIVKDPSKPQSYFPQIKIPLQGGGVSRLNLENLGSDLPDGVAQSFQNWIEVIGKSKMIKVGNEVYNINNSADLFEALKKDVK